MYQENSLENLIYFSCYPTLHPESGLIGTACAFYGREDPRRLTSCYGDSIASHRATA